jgi:hypothetical protein
MSFLFTRLEISDVILKEILSLHRSRFVLGATSAAVVEIRIFGIHA